MSHSIKAQIDTRYPAATQPTMYFIGVTTARSSIMSIFPRWAQHLGLNAQQDVAIQGIDCRCHDEPATYRRIVEHIRDDPLSLGALVTTHKINLLTACRDLFDDLDEFACLMGEASCISKRDGRLIAHAKDALTSGLALEAFLPVNHWRDTGAEAFIMGAGGAAIALSAYLLQPGHGEHRPARIVMSDRDASRLKEVRKIHTTLKPTMPIEYHETPKAEDNTALLATLAPHSLAINATGLGKDTPGSPITDAAVFPQAGYAWDFNYRGDLRYLDQARAQAQQQRLHVEDGWAYFVHGWTQVIAEVFNVDIPPHGPTFDELSRIAAETRG